MMINRMLASFCLTSFILIFLMVLLGFAPFGNLSFVAGDGEVQYLDFFAYLRHLLLDDASAIFSFDKGLGGNTWAIMTYYLFSPFNILIIFFNHEEMHTFYDVLVVLKLSLSAMMMTYYLEERFEHKLSAWVTILLSLGFGLMNYNVQQLVNIMWLDPVYMLPLMMLGLHKLRRNNSILMLTITFALAMLFNWYTGLIAIMFVGIFSVWEFLICSDSSVITHKNFFIFEGKVLLSIALAVGLNAVQFVPTLEALSDGRGTIDWYGLHLALYTKVWNIFQGLTWGNRSMENQVSLFTGDLVTFGMVAFFLQKNINKRLILGGAAIAVFIWLMFYWRPFVFLFSLLKCPLTYWYRYSFPAHFMLIYLSAIFFMYRSTCQKWRFQAHKLYIFLFSLYPIAVIWRHFKHPLNNWDIGYFNTWENVIGSLMVYSAIVTFFCVYPRLESDSIKMGKIILFGIIIFGMGFNTKQYMEFFASHNVDYYIDYVIQQKAQINNLIQTDATEFRINQSRNFEPNFKDDDKTMHNFNANYNEGLAFGYHTLASYTSSPINAQLHLMDHLGYRNLADSMSIINVPILPADSLLGVKYVLSDIPIEGLTLLSKFATYNDKSTYLNEFFLPFAFVCNDFNLDAIEYNGNPFDYTNSIYKHLFGEDVIVYNELPCRTYEIDNKNFIFELSNSNKQGAIYGNLPTLMDYQGLLNIDNREIYRISFPNSGSVFYIPQSDKDGILLEFSTELEVTETLEPQFYMVDEMALTKAKDKAQSRAAQFVTFENRNIIMKVNAKAGEKLFTTIPYKDWQITLNGKTVSAEIILDCLMGLTLEDGENIIEMSYTLPGLKLGLSISILSLILLAGYIRKFEHKIR